MTSHLLVTNDFPPKVGGIQTYLWELWRRLPAPDVTVLTTNDPAAGDFDSRQAFRIERVEEPVLLPTPALARRIRSLAEDAGARFVVVDPALPLGVLAPRLRMPYVVVVHGSELAGRIPGGAQVMGHVVAGARHVVAAGGYPAAEAARVAGDAVPPVTVIPPGVDAQRFAPVGAEERRAVRRRFGLPDEALVVAGLSRLVPRKGFDVLLAAAAELQPRYPDLCIVIGGEGRDRPRLQRLVDRLRVPARLIGRVADEDLPGFYAAADVFAMCCRTRWAGLEVEGFGIVFLEAAAAGVPQLAGASGGAADAVSHGETGFVVDRPDDPRAVARALEPLLADPALRARMGAQSRARVEADFTYDHLSARLAGVLDGVG